MAIMNFQKVDKIPLIPTMGLGAFNIMPEGSVTANRWHVEGLPIWYSAVDYFGITFTFESVPIDLGMFHPFPVKTLYEDEQYIIIRDANGVKEKNF